MGIIINNAYNPDNDPIDPYPVASNGTFEVGGIAESTTISLPIDTSAEHGDTVVVPLMANNVTNLAGFDIDIKYNPLVVNVTGASVNDSFGGSAADGMCSLKNAGQGSVKLVSWNFDGYTGDCHLVDITLEAVGTADQTTELGIIINNAYNPDNDPIDPYPVASNGTFEVNVSGVNTTGDIIINEIMYAPTEPWGGSTNEWIELYNNDTKSIDITDWTIDGKTISGTTMQPDDYVIIARNDTKFTGFYQGVMCTVIDVNIILSNDGEMIYLNDSSSTEIDSVNYTEYAAMGMAKVNKTLERNATGGWEESLVDGGTPCNENSVLLLSLDVTTDPTSVTENTATDVTFTVTSEGTEVDGALVVLLGCGVDTNGTTDENGTVTISVTATSTGTIDVTATKDGYDDATTSVDVNPEIAPMTVAADPTNVINNTLTDVTFTVTSEGTEVDGALVVLLGCGVDTNGTTDENGTVMISVTATSTGTIDVTATKDGYADATTSVDVNPPSNNTYYRDADGDGYGDPANTTEADSAPDGYVSDNTDCDDTNADVNPGATEVCNGIDDNCDGQIDEGVMTTYYGDADGDGYGDPANTTEACSAPDGYVTDNTDCDDNNAAVNPGATEVRNGIDDDCDGEIDEGCPTILSATLSPNVIQSDGTDSTTLTVLASDDVGIASVTVNLSAIGADEQVLDQRGEIVANVGTWTATINTTCNGTFVLPVTATDDDGSSDTTDVTLTAGLNTYTLSLKQGWNMISLPCNVTTAGIDTTQKLGDLITDAGEDCYYVAWFNATSQTMVSDIIIPIEGVPQDNTYPILVGQGYFVFVADDLNVVVAGTQW